MRAARPIVALALVLAASSATAGGSVFDHPATPESLARDLAPAVRSLQGARTLRGSYAQEKRLAGVPRPLTAEGSFLFVRDLGIAWRTVTPFETELVITASDVIQREGGRVSLHLSAERQPAVRVVSEIFAAVFALDFAQLGARFELFGRAVPGGWELGLRPRAGQAAGLAQVLVSGDAYVQRLRLTDAAGDTTELRLRDTVASPQPPPEDERRRFSPAGS
jgi:hypothetical protein